MTRRKFLQASSSCLLGANMLPLNGKTHILTLSFDDGFKKSFFKTADIYERFGLRGCFNVIARGHEQDLFPMGVKPDQEIVRFPKGTWDDWNLLKRRGHEVMAHTFDHQNLTTMPLEDAKRLIDLCASSFEAHLHGFQAAKSVYNFAYNASNPELDRYALSKFLVVRTQGNTPINPIPTRYEPVRIGCYSFGPNNGDAFLEDQIEKFLRSPGGWFVYNTHGLDDEGWGPISSKYLTSLLARLTALKHLEVLPAGEVVLRLAKAKAT